MSRAPHPCPHVLWYFSVSCLLLLLISLIPSLVLLLPFGNSTPSLSDWLVFGVSYPFIVMSFGTPLQRDLCPISCRKNEFSTDKLWVCCCVSGQTRSQRRGCFSGHTRVATRGHTSFDLLTIVQDFITVETYADAFACPCRVCLEHFSAPSRVTAYLVLEFGVHRCVCLGVDVQSDSAEVHYVRIVACGKFSPARRKCGAVR